MNCRPHNEKARTRHIAGLTMGVALSLSSAAAAQAAGPVLEERPRCQMATATRDDADARPLTITFFGVSTLMFDDGRDRVLVDGFFSRPGAARTLFLPIEPNLPRVLASLGEGPPRVRALLVAHAHHDHALDVALVSRMEPNALVIGTPSVIGLAEVQNVSRERLCLASDRPRFDLGSFTIRAIDSPHGPSLPVVGPMIDRQLQNPPRRPAHFTRFTDNRNLSFLIAHGERTRVLVHPSAGSVDMSALHAGIVFVGMGRVGTMTAEEADAYFADVVAGASLIVPIHWDAFTTPPDEPLRASPWPLDDVPRGFSHLCRFVRAREGLTVLKPEMRSALLIAPEGTWIAQGRWAPLCE